MRDDTLTVDGQTDVGEPVTSDGAGSSIALGIILGAACGVFFGEYVGWLKWFGDAFVGLLQMTVLPYVTLSLVCNVGRFSARDGKRIAIVSLIVMAALWLLGLVTVGIMQLCFPRWEEGSFFCASLIEEPAQMDWLQLFIPSNPFSSLTNNFIPAVVVFSIGLGAALMGVPNKETLLEKLDIVLAGLSRLNRMVLRLSPLGMFAIVAQVTGTTDLQRFGLLQGYVLAYVGATLVLTFWVLPTLIACCTPFSRGEILRAARPTLVAAFVIGNTFVLLPMIMDALRKLQQRHAPREGNARSTDYLVELAYPFPDIGRLVVLLFIPFAAWFYGAKLDTERIPQLIGVGLAGAFAKPVVTVPMLLDMADLPADIFNLFLASGVLMSRFGDLMKVMHLFVFAIATASILGGAFRVDLKKLGVCCLSSGALFAAAVWGTHAFLVTSFQHTYGREKLVVARELLGPPVEFKILQESSPNPTPRGEGEDALARIERTGVIRIGVDLRHPPYTYLNRHGDLVGFDVDMAHQLARDLGVSIEFVPFVTGLEQRLEDDHFDIAMSGLESTMQRGLRLPELEHYLTITRALVVPDNRRRQFRSLDRLAAELRRGERLRVAVVKEGLSNEGNRDMITLGAGWGAIARREFVDLVAVVEIDNEAEFFEADPPVADVLETSAEEGSVWTLKYPRYSVVKPSDLNVRTRLHYFVADRGRLRDAINNWIKLKRDDGTIEQLFDYWILGEEPAKRTPRWSVIRNALHWVD